MSQFESWVVGNIPFILSLIAGGGAFIYTYATRSAHMNRVEENQKSINFTMGEDIREALTLSRNNARSIEGIHHLIDKNNMQRENSDKQFNEMRADFKEFGKTVAKLEKALYSWTKAMEIKIRETREANEE